MSFFSLTTFKVFYLSQFWVNTRLSEFTFTFHCHALGKEMATHSSVLAWRIPGIGEPGGLQSLGSHRVRHDWSNLAAAAAGMTRALFNLGLDISHSWCKSLLRTRSPAKIRFFSLTNGNRHFFLPWVMLGSVSSNPLGSTFPGLKFFFLPVNLPWLVCYWLKGPLEISGVPSCTTLFSPGLCSPWSPWTIYFVSST